MKCLRFSLFLFLIMAAVTHLRAQVSFTAKASQKVIGLEDMVEIEFVLSGVSQVDLFTPPSFSPFTVVQGPSYTSGFNLINGNASSYYSVSYYLKPSNTGKFTLGPATVQINGQAVHSGSVNVEVVKGSTGAGAPAPVNPFQGMMGMNTDPFAAGREAYGDQFLRKGEKAEDKIRKNLILKMNVNKNTCYVGEPLVATCKLYSRLESESKVAERPSFSGFSVFEMAQPEQGNVSREVLGGKPFNAYLIRKAQLYPLQSGDLTIEPVELDNSITFYRQGKSPRAQAPGGTVLDQMMKDLWGDESSGAAPEKHTLNLTTNPITIHVKPLPEEGKPANFSGAVGQFTLQSALANTSPRANETDTLVLVLAGSGNLPMVNAPSLHFPSGLDSYDPSAKEQVDPTISPLKGRKVFSYTFTADKEGNYTLPAISFTYFDPQAAAYKTLTTDPLLLKVLPGTGASRRTPGSGNQPSAQMPYLKWIGIGAAALIATFVLVGFLRKRKRSMASPKSSPSLVPVVPVMPQPSAAFMQQAARDARVQQQMSSGSLTTYAEKDWLEEARRRLRDNGDSGAYFRALNSGLWGMLQHRLDLGAERNKRLVLDRLERKGFSAPVREEVRQLLEECELALYAPVHSGHDMQRAMDVAERVGKRLEHNLVD